MSLTKPVIAYKIRATSVNFGVFLLFSLLLGFVTCQLWYPHYLFWTDGGLQGLRLLCAVEFVLGPLLALVFFHPEKSRRKLVADIVVVIVLQILALGWGALQIYRQRPLVVVYGENRFISVAPQILGLQGKTASDMTAFSPDTPPYAYRRDALTDAEKMKKDVLLMRYGIHMEAQAWLFEPFLANLDRVFDRQQELRRYIDRNLRGEWDAWVASRVPAGMDAYRFALYEGRYANAVLVFSGTGQYLGYLPLGGGFMPDIYGPAQPSVDKAH